MIDLRHRRVDEPARAVEFEEAEEEICQAVEARQFPKSSDFAPLWSKYKHQFAEAQHGGKCAYCETRIRAGYPGDVEHYRPKAEVKEPRDRGNRDDTRGESPGRSWHKPTRPGYWWLAYRLDNYLYSCNRCNNWKSNSFPLRQKRGAMVPGAEADENPLILNPYLTDPSGHLGFNELGEILGATEEGEVTIDRCGLDRRSLVVERERIAGQLLRDVEDYSLALGAGNEMAESHALRRFLSACEDPAPYAAMARALVTAKTGLRYEELLEARDLGLLDG